MSNENTFLKPQTGRGWRSDNRSIGMQVITVDKPMWIKHGKMERHFNVRWSRTKQQYAIEN